MENKNSSLSEESQTVSKTSEPSYIKGKEEITKFEIKIEEDKYSINKPRKVTITARIINDWSTKNSKWKSFSRGYL